MVGGGRLDEVAVFFNHTSFDVWQGFASSWFVFGKLRAGVAVVFFFWVEPRVQEVFRGLAPYVMGSVTSVDLLAPA